MDSPSPYFDFVCEAEIVNQNRGVELVKILNHLHTRSFSKSAMEKNLKVYLTFQGSISRHMVNISYLKK